MQEGGHKLSPNGKKGDVFVARFLVVMLALLLCGCVAVPQTQPVSNVVAEIVVEGTYEGQAVSGVYTASDVIRNILLHIRALRPKHNAHAEGEGEMVRILLTYRDGRQKKYLLKAATYWQEDDGLWKAADGAAAERLCLLLLQLQGENSAAEKSLQKN